MAINLSGNFILRKLHQITGIVPLGIYVLVHLFTNSKAMNGEKVFNDAVADIHHLPFLLLIEIFGIFIPLLFHSIYGIMISSEARMNAGNYGYARNWFYVLQRISGGFLFFFILFHVLHLRFGLFSGFGLTELAVAGRADQAYQIVAADFKHLWILVLYILGVAATAWHLAYGIFLFAVDWGLVIGERAQRLTLYAAGAIGLAVLGLGLNAAAAFVRPCGIMPAALCETAERRPVNPGPVRF